MVAFGALNRTLDLFPAELVQNQIHGLGKKALVDTNIRAFESGTAAVGAEVKVGVT
jgi:Pyruvate/2-oxoacid:ferredoxin oxidoreductase gamma subunit